MKQKISSLVLMFIMVLSLAIPAFAAEAPTPENKKVIIWSDDARVGKDESATMSFYALYDEVEYCGVDSIGFRLQASTALTATKGSAVGIGFQMGFAPNRFWTDGVGNIAGAGGAAGEDAYGVTINFPKVPETTPLSVETVQLFRVIHRDNPENETLLTEEFISTDVGDVIVQYPVTVEIEGTVPTGASISMKTTTYKTATETPADHITFNSGSTTSTPISNGSIFWVDSGAGQQNRPTLNFVRPSGYIAQYDDNGTYKDAGASLTLDEITGPTTIKIKYAAQTESYDVIYHLNNGTTDTSKEEVTIPEGQTVVHHNLKTTPGVTYDDNKFLGWSKTAVTEVLSIDDTVPALIEAVDVKDADHEVYAIWREPIPSTYKFIFNVPTTLKTGEEYTSGTVQLTVDEKNELGYPHTKLKVELTAKPEGSNPIATAPIIGNLIGANYTLPVPVTNNFTFSIPISKLLADKPGTYTMKVSLLNTDNNDMVICQASHTIQVSDNFINYNLDGGTNATGNPTGAATGADVSIAPPTKTGFTFVKWESTEVAVVNGTDPTVNPATFKMPAKDITLKAVFETAKYDVTFDSKGGTAVAKQTVVHGQKATKPADPTLAGKTFDGWYLNGTKYDFNTPVTAKITLTAQYKAVSNTVAFDPDNGSAVINQTVEYGQKATKPADPTKEGYAFDAWYLNGAKYDFNTPVTGNLNLKAQYKANAYTVEFDSDGGTSVDNQTVNHGGKVTKPANPTKDGYTFEAWYVGSVKYDFNAAVTGNLTLVAHYTVDSNPDNPSTGNYGDVGLWIALMVLATVGACGIYKVTSDKVKRKEE